MRIDICQGVLKYWAGSLLVALLAISRPVISANPNELTGSSLPMRLTGIIINNDSRSALIKIGSAREKIFDQGANVQDDVTLDAVKENYVLLSVRGQIIRLELEKDKSPDHFNPGLPEGTLLDDVIPAEVPVVSAPPVIPGLASDDKVQEQRDREQEREEKEQDRQAKEQERQDLLEQQEEQQSALTPATAENPDNVDLENPSVELEPGAPGSGEAN